MRLPAFAETMEASTIFRPAKVLLSAIELGLFTKLGGEAKTGTELQEELGLHPRSNPDFFDTLVALKFLERTATAPIRITGIPRKRPYFSTGLVQRSWAVSWRWQMRGFTHFGEILLRPLKQVKPKTRQSTVAKVFSKSYIENRIGWNSSWTQWRGSLLAILWRLPTSSTFPDFIRFAVLAERPQRFR